MNKQSSAAVVAAAGLIVALAPLAGCTRVFAPQPDTTRFYVLTPTVHDDAPPIDNPHSLVVGVGPVRLPGYLDRPQFVTRADGNRVVISDFDRWAEPLHEGFARVLGQNLASRLGAEVISRFPWPVGSRLDYQIEIDVIRFEAGGGQAQLASQWAVKDAQTRALMISRYSTINQRVEGSGSPGEVAALSASLGELASEIAGQVRALASTRRSERRTDTNSPIKSAR